MAEGNDRAAVEHAKCAADAAYFIDSLCIIDDTQGHGDGGGTMPFRLWPSQFGVVWDLMTHPLVIILKARQLGISWLCCAYALWHCLFQPNKTALLYSQGQEEANELLRRVKVLYQRLPEPFRARCPAIVQDNTTVVLWSNGSRIRSLPATQKAGRSFTASLVVLDEAAHLQWGEQLYTALKPTIDGGGQLVVLSTANGIGNLFHNLWLKAAAGANRFKTIFLPWWDRPGRDQAWYDAKVAEETDPGKCKQEYPSSPGEAFRVSGRVRFAPEWVEAQAPNVRESLPRHAWPEPLRKIQALRVYELPPEKAAVAPPPGTTPKVWIGPAVTAPPAPKPPPPRKFVIGADVAEGLEHGDYSDAAVIDAETWEEVASLHGHWEPDEFAGLLQALAEAWDAMIAVERNNHGHAVLVTLKALRSRYIGCGLDGKPGWLTNDKTKPVSIDLLATALRDHLITVRTQAALDEMHIYRVNADGSTSAPTGYHDDRVMSRAIALCYARSATPKQSRMY